MNKVTLTRLAVIDLGVTFARRREGNKITHYTVNYSSMMVGIDPLEAVRKYIEKEEGPTEIEVVVQEARVHSGLLAIESIGSILDNDPEIKAALENKSVKSTLLQEIRVTKELTFVDRMYNAYVKIRNKTATVINSFIVPLQQRLRGITMQDYIDYQFSDADDEKTMEIGLKIAKIKFLRMLESRQEESHRMVHPCTYLSLSYEEGDEKIAEQILLQDLRKFYNKGMILGHLAMPSRIALADTVGSGKRYYAMFCFLFADFTKIDGYSAMNYHELYRRQGCPLDGIRSACMEGDLKALPELDYSNRYEVEKIDVHSTYEENQKAYVDNYLDNVPHVNAAAARMRKRFKSGGQ